MKQVKLAKLKRYLTFLAYGAGAFALLVLIVNLFVHLRASPYTYKSVADLPEAETVLIPGAAILEGGKISPIFKDRVDRAIEVYNAGKASKILVSGDNSTVSHNEVNPVRIYLLSKGIPDADIFLDHAGFDTYSSIYRARDIFEVSSLIISTQSFHLPRALFIARSLGLQAYGLSADEGHIRAKNYLREVVADEKAVINVLFRTKPKYLGDVIPITGDGRNYP